MLYYNIPYHNAILYYKILYYTTLHYTTLYFTLLIGNNILYYLHPRHRVKGCGLAQRYKRACVRLPRALTPYVVRPSNGCELAVASFLHRCASPRLHAVRLELILVRRCCSERSVLRSNCSARGSACWQLLRCERVLVRRNRA